VSGLPPISAVVAVPEVPRRSHLRYLREERQVMAKINLEHREFALANRETIWRDVYGNRTPDQERRHAANPEWFEVARGSNGGRCAMCTWGVRPPEPKPARAPAPATEATGRPVGRPTTAPAHERVDRADYDENERPYVKALVQTKSRSRARPGEKTLRPAFKRLIPLMVEDLKAMGYEVKFVPTERDIPNVNNGNPGHKRVAQADVDGLVTGARVVWVARTYEGKAQSYRLLAENLSHEFAHVENDNTATLTEPEIDALGGAIMRSYGRPRAVVR
jgi:hypothetical protein